MNQVSKTPAPPYYAVIFTSVRMPSVDGYAVMAQRMAKLSSQQEGFLGMEHADNDDVSITICYWDTTDAIAKWKQNVEHRAAQAGGYEKWYKSFTVRICKVERDNTFER
ncbi:MAG: antibiotic biosynthesis monooxygenase [Pyrinomonadaceae bacterium]